MSCNDSDIERIDDINYVRSIWTQLHGRIGSPVNEDRSIFDATRVYEPKQLSAILGEPVVIRFRDISRRDDLVRCFGLGSIERFECLAKLLDLNAPDIGECSHTMHSTLIQGEQWLALCKTLLNGSNLKCACPWTGDTIESIDSIMFATDKWGVPRYAYRFESVEPFYVVVVGHVACQLSSVFFPRSQIIVNFTDSSDSERLDSIGPSLRAFLIHNADTIYRYFSRPERQKRRRALLVSSYHFAHHLWNELSAVEGLTEDVLGDCEVYVTNAPFGPIQELFPNIPESSIKMRYAKRLDEISVEAIERNIFWVPLGRTFIPSSLTDRVLARSADAFPKDVIFSSEIRKNHDIVVWISTRQDLRLWTNQIDVVSQLLEHVSRRFGSMAVIFDGYTPGFQGMVSSKTVDSESWVVKTIIEKTGAKFTGISLIGARLQQALVWGGIADIYIANHGTIQHKIGWFYDIPGICHYCPPKNFNAQNFGGLYASQRGAPPRYVFGEGVARAGLDDFRKDLQDYAINSSDLIATFDSLLCDAHLRQTPPLIQSSFHHITEFYYDTEIADEFLRDGDLAWGRRDFPGAIDSYVSGIKVAPKYLRVQRRFLEYVLMNFISWFPGAEFAEARVAALQLILLGLSPNNAWARERLLVDILSISSPTVYKRVLADTTARFPEWGATLLAQVAALRLTRRDISEERLNSISELQ